MLVEAIKKVNGKEVVEVINITPITSSMVDKVVNDIFKKEEKDN